MRRWTSHISIVLLFAISLGITWQAITIVHFYANQDQIENEYCVNKDKPELECHGKCHLSEVLSNELEEYADLNVKLTSSLIVFQAFQAPNEFSFDFSSKQFKTFASEKSAINSGFLLKPLDPPEIIS